MHDAGLQGMPRRIPDYPTRFLSFMNWSSYGSFLTIIGLFVFKINLICSMIYFKNDDINKKFIKLNFLLRIIKTDILNFIKTIKSRYF